MHLALPIIGAVVLLALFAGREPDRSTAMRRLTSPPKRVSGPGTIVPFTRVETEEGDVVIEPLAQLAQQASSKLGRPVNPDAFLLATMISSEEGRGSADMQAGVAWAATNRARRRGLSLQQLLTPDGRLAGQSVGYPGSSVRYAAADEPPTEAHLRIAEGVLARVIPDPTGGATGFDSPRTQRILLARGHGKTKRTPEQVAEERVKSGLEMVKLPGIDAERLRFWRPRTKAGVSGEMDAKRAAIVLRDAGDVDTAYETLVGAYPDADDEAIYGFLAYAPPANAEPARDGYLGWAYDDGLSGHDETYQDIGEDAMAGKKAGVPNYPVPALVKALADKWGLIWGVPPSFIQTIAEIESSLIPAKSNLNDRAIKLGGAWGLMAITFTSALDLVRWVKAAPENAQYQEIKRILKEKWRGKAENLLDPELNVMLGSYYLARLYKEFADFDRTAAAYHAGPGNVRRAIKRAVRDGTGNWKRHLGPYSNIYVAKATDTYPKYGPV